MNSRACGGKKRHISGGSLYIYSPSRWTPSPGEMAEKWSQIEVDDMGPLSCNL